MILNDDVPIESTHRQRDSSHCSMTASKTNQDILDLVPILHTVHHRRDHSSSMMALCAVASHLVGALALDAGHIARERAGWHQVDSCIESLIEFYVCSGRRSGCAFWKHDEKNVLVDIVVIYIRARQVGER